MSSPSPAAISDDKGNTVVFKDVVDMYWLERFARSMAVDMGAGAGLATAPMPAGFLATHAIPGTVTEALDIGRAMSTPPIVIEPFATVEKAALLLAEHRIGCLPVVDGEDLVGLVTATDVLFHFAGGSPEDT